MAYKFCLIKITKNDITYHQTKNHLDKSPLESTCIPNLLHLHCMFDLHYQLMF